MIPKSLIEILACPKCKGDLKYVKQAFICEKCRLKYKIIEGDIPNMLIEEAEKI